MVSEDYVKKLEEENKSLVKRVAELEIREGKIDFMDLRKGELYRSYTWERYGGKFVLTGSLKFLLDNEDPKLSNDIYACVSDECAITNGKDVKKCFEMPQSNFKKQIFNAIHKGPTDGSY